MLFYKLWKIKEKSAIHPQNKPKQRGEKKGFAKKGHLVVVCNFIIPD